MVNEAATVVAIECSDKWGVRAESVNQHWRQRFGMCWSINEAGKHHPDENEKCDAETNGYPQRRTSCASRMKPPRDKRDRKDATNQSAQQMKVQKCRGQYGASHEQNQRDC